MYAFIQSSIQLVTQSITKLNSQSVYIIGSAEIREVLQIDYKHLYVRLMINDIKSVSLNFIEG